MKTKFSGILTLLLAFVVQLTFAQGGTISGTVSDQDGLPLPGVNIVVKGTSNGTQTDFDGNYSINASSGEILVFSYVGLTSQEVAVGSSSTVNVTMQEDLESLSEVVVTAYGIKKEKRSVGYAVQEVKSEAIVNSGASNVLDALSGKSSGVQVTRSSGSAGGGSRIVIRGATSMVGNNQALIIIDGVRSNNETLNAQGGGTAGTAQSNRLMDLNSEDIENISVLKGAAATAIYGTAGSGGVILITTKKGSKGQKFAVNVSSQIAFDRVSQLTALQDTYAQGRVIGGVPTWRGPETGESGSWGPRLSDLEYSNNPADYDAANGNSGRAFDAEGNYRWDNNGFLVARGTGNGVGAKNYNKLNSDDFFRTGVSTTQNIGISGSTDKLTYRFSASDLDQQGVVPNEQYKRRTFNLGATLQASEKLSFESAINYTRSDYDRIQQGSNTSGLLLGLYRTPASFDNSNGLGANEARDNRAAYEFADRSQRNYRGGGGYDNPYWTINNAPGVEEVHRVFGNFKANYNLNNWMNFGLNVGVDVTDDKRKQSFEVGSRTNPTGRILLDNYLTRQSDVNLFVTGDGDLTEDFEFNYTLGANFFSFIRDRQNTTGIGLLFPGFMDISNVSTVQGFEDVNKYRSAGVFVNSQIGWKRMLYLNFSARQDYDNRLRDPAKARNLNDIDFFYPSISGSWIFTEVLPDNDILSFGKVRASWAQVGAPPPFPYLTSTAYEVGVISGGWGNGITFPIDGVTSFELDNLAGNANLKPELTTTKEFGVDLRFLKNRLTLDAAYFTSDVDDAILNASLAPSSGFTSKWVNAGIMTSEGWEITLGGSPVVSDNFNWNTTLNWSASETIVKQLAPGIERLFLAGFATAGTYLVEGLPYGAIVGGAYLRQEAGTASDTSLSIPGGPVVIDDATGYQAVDNTQRVIGDPNPDFILGWNNSLSYKNLTLNFLLDWKKGGDVWNGTAWALSFFGRSELTAQTREETPIILDGVLPDGSPNNIPIVRDRSYWTSNVGGFGSVGEQFVDDGSWVRLRELSLSYQFPSKLFDNFLLDGAYVTFTGRNLWIDTDYNGVDPETSLTGNGNGQGFDYFNNPGTKSYMFKIGFNF